MDLDALARRSKATDRLEQTIVWFGEGNGSKGFMKVVIATPLSGLVLLIFER
jgi:hypothetical protein